MLGPSLHGEFLRHAVLETVVPHAPDVDIETTLTTALEEGAEDLTSVLKAVPQRSLLFFDETVTVRVVLRLSNCSENALRFHLPQLDIGLNAFVFNPAELGSAEPGPTKDLIFSGTVHDKEDPLVVVNIFEGDEESGNHVYVIWKIKAFLRRPRIRIQHPCVAFSAAATLNTTEIPEKSLQEDDYLPSTVPASANVLQPLSTDTSFKSVAPFLPASRLLRVVPATQKEAPVYNIWQQTQNPIRIVPAASARIRCTRLNTFSSRPTTIASLDLEATPFLGCDIVFDKADIVLFDGQAENMSNVEELQPPILLRPRDDVTLMYKLIPEYGPESYLSTTALVSMLDISLEGVINLSGDCQPRIAMQWRTNVDFSMPLNPTFGGPSQTLQRNNRPASLPVTPGQGGSSSSTSAANRSSYRERAHSITQGGVTISFSGPATVEVSKPFQWDVFIVNRSNAPRKFAMMAIPRRKRVDPRRHVARPSSSSVSSRKEDRLAEAVTDESIIHAMQKNASGQDADLICLSTELRIGPLLPGTCHSTELILLPLATGSLHLEVVRLVDMNTNETIDIRDLPDIVSLDRSA
ncbi:TRAPP trafficking subunit Trs65-domain-containing protein [Talaromyces proteolyticus]|uniref:TRAPP trafficking subunit Trs65-domain-containing protein n=1 Tax=Talaromyces proteolyticus TaxID=1131652 RepID=A0AAD4PX69_9EURO|nr:TRAPP trafficking subunit Trs65-domain-containing protein [Talaromyces proteolyticus]KAH8693182.1 TRAPP trafficking subunit Trs65-domain-containing protein [Talaromyces proteolyticus]